MHDKPAEQPVDVFERLATRVAPWGHYLAWAIVAFLGLAHLYDLGYSSLHPWDECLYALRARWALRGFWLDQYPHCYGPAGLTGFYSGAFPPLYVWTMAISMKLLGPTTFAARLPSALYGTGCVWLMYRWGAVAWNRTTGVWAAFSLAAWFLFITHARRAQFDIPVTFWITLTAYWGMRYYKEGSRRWLLLAGVAMGLGLMTKILIAGFAAVALLLYGLLLRARGDYRFRRLFIDQVILNAVGVGLALPWHLYMVVKYQTPRGNEFLDYYWGYHIARRSAETLESNYGEWHYYFMVVWHFFAPLWIFALLVGLGWALWRTAWKWGVVERRGRSERARREAEAPAGAPRFEWTEEHALALPLVWIAFVLAISMSMTTKREVYMFPFTTALALVTGRLLGRFSADAFPDLGRRLFGLGAAFLFIAWRSRGEMRLVGKWLRHDSPLGEKATHIAALLWPIAAGAVAIVVVAEAIRRFFPRVRRFPVLVTLAFFVAIGWIQGVKHNFERKSMREYHWDVVDETVRKGDFKSLVFIGFSSEPDLTYYLDGIDRGWQEGIGYLNVYYQTHPELATPLPSDPDRVVVTQKGYVEQTPWTPEQVGAFLRHYRIVAENRNFAIYRSRNVADDSAAP